MGRRMCRVDRAEGPEESAEETPPAVPSLGGMPAALAEGGSRGSTALELLSSSSLTSSIIDSSKAPWVLEGRLSWIDCVDSCAPRNRGLPCCLDKEGEPIWIDIMESCKSGTGVAPAETIPTGFDSRPSEAERPLILGVNKLVLGDAEPDGVREPLAGVDAKLPGLPLPQSSGMDPTSLISSAMDSSHSSTFIAEAWCVDPEPLAWKEVTDSGSGSWGRYRCGSREATMPTGFSLPPLPPPPGTPRTRCTRGFAGTPKSGSAAGRCRGVRLFCSCCEFRARAETGGEELAHSESHGKESAVLAVSLSAGSITKIRERSCSC